MQALMNGITMNYRDEGHAPPLLLLHAFPLSSKMWNPQMGLRGKARLIIPDLRGFGHTDTPDESYSLDDMASDALALLDHLKIEQFVLGGLSMGGYLSFALLRRIDRSRVRGLILADTKAGADTEEARKNRLAMAEQAEREGSAPIAEAMTGKLLGATSLETRPHLVEEVKEIIRDNNGAGIAGAQRAMAARLDSTDLLPQLNMPALILVGEEDTLTPPSEAEKMAAALPNARLEVIPHAGHLSNMEEPEIFNAHVLAFLRHLEV